MVACIMLCEQIHSSFGSVRFGLVWLGFCELGSISKHNVLEFESLCSFPLKRIDLGAATQYPLGIPEV